MDLNCTLQPPSKPYFVSFLFLTFLFCVSRCFINTFSIEPNTIRYLCAEKATSYTHNIHSGDDDDDDDDANFIHSKSSSDVAPSSIEIITRLGANLASQLLADVDLLFISQPMTIYR